ncbi:MAG: hypothetical protein MJY47_06645 [Fibrobacter sp.]|nr:hypothetical protein [Fibrobacter sp.]
MFFFFFNKLKVHPKIQYKICIDLSKKIDIPFYAEAKIGERSNMSPVECAKEYVRLLIQFDDKNFSEKFLNYLTRQQQQTFRKIHLRSSKQIERKKRYGKNVSGSTLSHQIIQSDFCSLLFNPKISKKRVSI